MTKRAKSLLKNPGRQEMTKRAKSLLTKPNIIKISESLAKAVGTSRGTMLNSQEYYKTLKRTLEIVRAVGGNIVMSGQFPVTEPASIIHFINSNRKRLHKFVFLSEPYGHEGVEEFPCIFLIPAEAAEKVLVFGWPEPAEATPSR